MNIIKKTKEIDKEYSFFNTIPDNIQVPKKGKLKGLYISVKDNICVKDMESTAGSKILDGYKPLFDATVIDRLKKEGAVVIGKTSMDAFGFGSFNVNVGIGKKIPKNPIDKTRVTGGSSGGAAGFTKLAPFSHVAISESTGGSIESPASFCGVIGFCPTYGRFSRYGLISYADSLDKIGLMANTVDELLPVYEICAGLDEMDATSLKALIDLKIKKSKLKIGLIAESMDDSVDPAIISAMKDTVKKLMADGHMVDQVKLPITHKYSVPAYYIIATSEASTNLARYSGLRYGQESKPHNKKFNEFFAGIRSRNFSEEEKRRIMLGTFARMAGYRDAYYIKATKVRTKVINEYKKLFSKYDILISPTMPVVAPKFTEIKKLKPIEHYMMDIFTNGPNLAGIPHASIPVGEKNGLPIGMMCLADHLEESVLFSFMKIIEDIR